MPDVTQDKTLIFFHIWKTGGQTLRSILRRNFPKDTCYSMNVGGNPQCVDEFRRLPEKKRGKIRYLDGHIPFGLHEYLPHSSTYITLLRDPVSRVISEYYSVIRSPNHPAYDEITSKNISLQDYARREVPPGVPNVQTRCISGVLWGDLLDRPTPQSGNILEIAKTNLREHFLLVGLSERFDESLLLLRRALGWRIKDILYSKRNVGRNRPSKDEITNDTLKLIESYNQMDIELYAWAKQMFEERIYQLGSSFTRELQIFRLCNKVYSGIINGKLYTGVILLRAVIGKLKAAVRSAFA